MLRSLAVLFLSIAWSGLLSAQGNDTLAHTNVEAQVNSNASTADQSSNVRAKKPKHGKKLKDPIVVSFDEGGHMIGFPPQVIRPGQRIQFRVRVSRSYFANGINRMFLRMDSLYDYFKTKQENQFVLWALFKVDEVRDWVKDLQNYMAMRQILKTDFYVPGTYLQSNERLYKLIDALKYFPVKSYVYKLLYEQFSVIIYDLSFSFKQAIKLEPDSLAKTADKNDCYWWYSTVYSIDSLLGRNCDDCNHQLNYSLMVQDSWKSMLNEWYNLQYHTADSILKTVKPGDELKGELGYLLKYRKEIGALKYDDQMADSLRRMVKKNAVTQAALPEPFFATSPVKGDTGTGFSVQRYLSALRSAPGWFFHWLWYNYQWLVVDPAPVVLPPDPETRKEVLKSSQRFLQRVLQQKKFLDSVKAHVPVNLVSLQEFKKAQDSSDSVDWKIDSVTKVIADLNKLVKADSLAGVKAAAAGKAANYTQVRAYAGVLPVLGGDKWYESRFINPKPQVIMKQFSYHQREGTLKAIYRNQRELDEVTELPDNERVLLVLHNIPVSSTLSVEQKLTGYNDLEEFTRLFQKLLKAIDSTGLLGTAMAPKLISASSFLMGLANLHSVNTTVEQSAEQLGKAFASSDKIDVLSLQYLQRSIQNDALPSGQSFNVATQLGSDLDTSGGYMTKLVNLVDSLAPFQVNLSIKVDSSKTKSVVQTGDLYRFQLLAGFAAVNSPVQQVSIDTTGNGFRTGSASNNTSAILGFKIYPAKAFLRDGSLWPRYPLRRFSFVAALSVPKPLNNFYLGGGYDLVPGLCFSMGCNIYRQNYYQVQNGHVTNSATRYANGGVYYSVGINPSLFVQFIKLFFN